MHSQANSFGARSEDLRIPCGEAIYYLEEILKEVGGLFVCANCSAPLYCQWCGKVESMLTVMFGADCLERFLVVTNMNTVGYQKELHLALQKTIVELHALVTDLKHSIAKNEFSRDCFVAMWFDSTMDAIYQTGIVVPLKKLGYNPVRVDKIEHNERIDQKIFDMIRGSRFLIADLTGCRGGVYYEAGFAAGLGIPVIHICKESDFAGRHFDVQTINTIKYNIQPKNVTEKQS